MAVKDNYKYYNMKKLLIITALATVLMSCERRHPLYEAVNRYTGKVTTIGSVDEYAAGDTVIVDETNFVDMTDENGTQYIIIKNVGSVPVQ